MKKIVFGILFGVCFCSLTFAESLTLTTYYPAPFGMYKEMRVMGKLGVGITDPTHKVEIVPDAGQGALVTGTGNTASDGSSAFGTGNSVSGTKSLASGTGNTVSGNTSFASGTGNTVSSATSFASGASNTVSGIQAFASGTGNDVSGALSFASGVSNIISATGSQSAAFGWENNITKPSSFATGYGNTVSSQQSFAGGEHVTAQAANSFVFGRYNVVSGSPVSWVPTEPLFVLGNGTSATPSNAMTVLKNGKVGVSTALPQATLHVGDGIGMPPVGSAEALTLIGTVANQPALIAVSRPTSDPDPASIATGRMAVYAAGLDYGIYSAQGENYFADSVGIGAPSGTQKLHVYNDTSPYTATITKNSDSNGAALQIYSGNGGMSWVGGKAGIYMNNANGHYGIFQATNSGATKNYFGGNVGIGVVDPTVSLDVSGQARIQIAETNGSCTSAADGGKLNFTPAVTYMCGGSSYTTSVLRLCSRDHGGTWAWRQVQGAWSGDLCGSAALPD